MVLKGFKGLLGWAIWVIIYIWTPRLSGRHLGWALRQAAHWDRFRAKPPIGRPLHLAHSVHLLFVYPPLQIFKLSFQIYLYGTFKIYKNDPLAEAKKYETDSSIFKVKG